MRHGLFVFLSFALAGAAWSQGTGFQDPYFYLQGDYVVDAELESPDATDEDDGYGAALSVPMTRHTLFALDYHNIGNSNMAFAGLGLHKALRDDLDLYGKVGYDRIEGDVGSLETDTGGIGGRAGLRFWPDKRLELAAELRLADHGDGRIMGAAADITSRLFSAVALYRISEVLALRAEYLTGEYEFKEGPSATTDIDRQDLRLGVRWYLEP